jgi:hypothetical protein
VQKTLKLIISWSAEYRGVSTAFGRFRPEVQRRLLAFRIGVAQVYNLQGREGGTVLNPVPRPPRWFCRLKACVTRGYIGTGRSILMTEMVRVPVPMAFVVPVVRD